ncbi:hypothetical protein [Streptomyces iconiensis]|uniref:Uncharacterized protein n=1 Tax=Streptomyces iconiensis TaxID=1384038 RepID=A0ABT7A9D8_9ACTN|nr:hypothetical protein [Streptomyces iconiensis]MDJ1137940.1 hypothetical protein [Streptomyces iconiensis]
MGQQIIRQPDGSLAVFSTTTDTIIVAGASPDELIEWHAEQAAQAAREQASRHIQHVLDGDAETVYGRRAMAWEDAVRISREHGGDLP